MTANVSEQIRMISIKLECQVAWPAQQFVYTGEGIMMGPTILSFLLKH